LYPFAPTIHTAVSSETLPKFSIMQQVQAMVVD